MKKTVACILGLLCGVSVLAFPACKEEVSAATLNSFENYDELRLVKPENCVGSMELNTDKKFVTEGDGSLKFHIDRTSALAAAGWVVSSADTGEVGVQHMNAALIFLPKKEYGQLGKVDEFCVDIFNANAYDTQLIFYANDVNETVMFSCTRTLKAGEMNEVSIPLNGHFYENHSTNVSNYKLVFAGAGVDETYYVDDFQAILGNGGKKSAEKSAADWEILSFDSESDYNYVNPYSYTLTPAVKSYYSENKLYSKDGGSLCLEMLPFNGMEEKRSSASQKATANGCGVEIYTGVISAKIAEADKIILDAYLAAAGEKALTVTLTDGTNWQTERFTLHGNEWTEIAVARKENGVAFDRLTQFVVTVDTTDNKETTKIYLDDLRYE